MIVCHCFGTTDREIRQALESGRATHCPAGQGCGGCAPTVQEIMSRFNDRDAARPRSEKREPTTDRTNE